MSPRDGTVHVVTTRRRYKSRVYSTHLLRRSFRDEQPVKNETVGNLSHLPEPLIEVIRRAYEERPSCRSGSGFRSCAQSPTGTVQAVRVAMQRLEFESLSAPGAV